MAKKAETINLIDQFAEFKELKGIDKTTMISVLEESFRKVIENAYPNAKTEITINPDRGDCEIQQIFEVVPDGEVENDQVQISVSDAQNHPVNPDPEAEVGDEFVVLLDFAKFGRRNILNLRQTLASKILELQKDAVYSKFKDLEGELVTAEVYQLWKRETLLLDEEKNEILMPKDQQIPTDYFRKGDTVKAVIYSVENKNNNPKILVSRTHDNFLKRLFELEVPEIHDGLIKIRAVARIPGKRAKIAVESYDDHIDPVGACVGVKGSRIHGIVRELRNENIDVIQYTSNIKLLIERALSPAKVNANKIHVDEEKKYAEVSLQGNEVSEAIGKGGLNIKLAIMLTGYQIEVFRDMGNNNEDIYLEEFSDEIEEWIIDALKNVGCITAKEVLSTPREVLIEKADLEENTVDEVLEILRNEFERE